MGIAKRLPWNLLTELHWAIREWIFSGPESDPNVRVYTDLCTLRQTLGRHHFTNDYEFSYDLGEDLNMRRPEFREEDAECAARADADPSRGILEKLWLYLASDADFEDEDKAYHWYQTHIRAYDRDSHIDVAAHYELEPSEWPEEHLRLVNYSSDLGAEKLIEILDAEGIEYDDLRDE